MGISRTELLLILFQGFGVEPRRRIRSSKIGVGVEAREAVAALPFGVARRWALLLPRSVAHSLSLCLFLSHSLLHLFSRSRFVPPSPGFVSF